MLNYDQQSRYYGVDFTYDLPQDNMFKTDYQYDTTTVLANESGRLDLVSYRVIARFNAIINPETAFAGTKLKIPRL